MQGDKKPVVMTEDIDQSVAKKLHAAQHAAGGSDPITPEAIGAVKGSWTMYTSLDELGLDVSVVTMDAILAAMADYSELNASINSKWPAGFIPGGFYGTLTVTKVAASRTFASFVPTNSKGVQLIGCVDSNGAFIGWYTFATTDYAVNKAGDTMTGVLNISSVRDTNVLRLRDASDNYVAVVNVPPDANEGTNTRFLWLAPSTVERSKALSISTFSETGAKTVDTVLHTGNKPHEYSYKGTGTGWAESLDTGGTGQCALIYGGDSEQALVGYFGAFYKSGTSVAYTTKLRFMNGKISNTSDNILNTASYSYICQVL